MLTDAVHQAEAHHLDPALLITLRARICGIYVILQDGPNLERASRELIDQVRQQYGTESPSLNLFLIYLQEALYLEGKYPEAIHQADENFTRFSRLLGPRHELTLATLANRAACEGQLGRYEAAIQDDLKLHAAEHLNPSGSRMEEGSLADAAMYECHAGNFRSGISHARQVISETSNGPMAQPMYTNGAMFTLAECLIGQEEERRPRPNSVVLDRAESLLRRVDVKSTDQLSGATDYEAWRNLAWARLALLREQQASARSYAASAQPSIDRPDADPYEKKALLGVRQTLNGSPGMNRSATSY
jgi:tetratricopeptide (TPR) repeat protein